MKLSVLRVLAIGATFGGFALAMNTEKAEAAEWTPRTVEQIKADVSKSNGNYTIVEGDHLWGISQATNITVQKLADMNKIANVDLIYAGNKLVFDGNVATVQNNKGETVAQSVIKPQDKVDPSQPVGQGTTSNTQTTPNTTTPTTPAGDQTGTTGGTTTPSTPESNNGGSTEGNNGEQTTPSTPENNGGTNTPSQPSQPGNGDNQGGTTTPSEPEKPQEPTIVSGYIGNSGKLFDTALEANTWAEDVVLESEEYTGYYLITIFYSDGSEKFSIDFY
ncbi:MULTISPECIES: LysM peptidoglycan-binding domain-containing protein [unclassified Enterococcus]|uniref:LysM peptidoglycan-binding domain-containing protein n=1 Tax=unclassified Enterococcus TaxID=2608891 RepID=UPI003F24D288